MQSGWTGHDATTDGIGTNHRRGSADSLRRHAFFIAPDGEPLAQALLGVGENEEGAPSTDLTLLVTRIALAFLLADTYHSRLVLSWESSSEDISFWAHFFEEKERWPRGS